MKKMTEKETWLRQAQMWGEARYEIDNGHKWFRPAPPAELWHMGICETIRLMPWELRDGMEQRLMVFVPPKCDGTEDYWWSPSPKGAEARMYACLFLAAMCDD